MNDRNQQRAGQVEHLDDEALSAYLDGTANGLAPIACAHAAAHLQGCPDCRADLADLTETLAMLHTLPQIAPRRSFILTPEAAAVVGGPRLPRRTPRWLWPTRWATALAGLIFAVTLGLGDGAANTPVPTNAAQAATRGVVPLCIDEPVQGCLSAQGVGIPIVFPTATPLAVPGAAQRGTTPGATDWRPLQTLSGSLALLGGFCGFLLPPLLRRRNGPPA